MNLGKKIVLIVGSLLCLLGLSYFLYTIFSDRRVAKEIAPVVNGMPVISSEQVTGSPLDIIYNRFKNLYTLDEKYVSLLADAASIHVLDSLQSIIVGEEKDLRKAVDNLQEKSPQQDDAFNFLRKSIDDRVLLRFAGGASLTSTGRAGLTANIKDMEMTLFKKNERIIELEGMLEDRNGGIGDKGTAIVNDKLRQREGVLNELQVKYNTLVQQNSSLTRRMGEIENKNVQRSPASNAPEDKLNELEAALRLAQVECNLTRADGHSIIYSSKQRKSLLEESLRILNSLSSSSNTAVQKQVKEKMVELKNIAGTIRD